MSLKEIIAKCASLKVEEQRSLEEDYAELVLLTEDTDAWIKALSEDLGAPTKPAGTEPTGEDLEATGNYGGIFANQTLFKKELNGKTILAMLWPWQDKTHTTLKMVLLQK